MLLHYSATPLPDRLLSRASTLSIGMKPRGFWLSADSAWKDWCESEKFRTDTLRHVYEIELRPKARILHVSTVLDIDLFHQEFCAPLYPGERMGMGIDWRRVGEKYDGIVIAPYQWSRRLDGGANWYYGWDCASGCIWRPRAIANVRHL